MSFIRRRIDLTFTLGEGNFGEGTPDGNSGSNTIQFSGLRCSVDIVKAGLPGADKANIRAWGLSKSHMNQLSTLGKTRLEARKNTVSIYAGDDESGLALLFTGNMQDAFQDFKGVPDASLNVFAFAGQMAALKPASSSSFQGSADVATILQGLATQAGYLFENNGVQQQLANPYYPGTVLDQIQAVIRHAGIYGTIDGDTLVIWPKDSSRGGDIAEFGPSSGLVGYPQSSADYGIGFTAVFRPGVVIGRPVKLVTSIVPANGEWVVNGLKYALESELPNGKWFMDIEGYRMSQVTP